MKYLKKWVEYLSSQPSLTIDSPIRVEGVCKKHLGPRLQYAIIELMVKPSNGLDINFSKEILALDKDSKELIDAAIYGIFDVIMVAKSIPLRAIKINFLSADIHPIDSNKTSFLEAGRDAGRKIIKSID
jgi:hypothetical protein